MKRSWTPDLLNEVLKESEFRLEFDHGKVGQSNTHDKICCVVTMEAATKTGQRTGTIDGRHRRVHKKHIMNMSRRARLGIPEAEEIICFGGLASWSI